MLYRRFSYQILIILILTSCNTAYEDYSGQINPVVISHTATGVYTDVAWLNEDTIAVIVDQGNDFVDNKMCVREHLVIINIKSGNSQEVDLQLEKDCMVYSISNLQSLPNRNIGYLYSETTIGDEKPSTIRQLEKQNDTYRLLLEESLILDQFTYSPDMTYIAATRVNGIDESKIFLVKGPGEEVDISPEFARAELAAWSNENIITFFGTKEFREEKEPSVQFYSFEKYLYYPWRLYLYDPVTAEVKEIPVEVVGPGELKWSPDSSKIAFRGEFNNIRGVWMVSNLDNFADIQIVRIIDAEATFDFSPDGKSMVFAYMGLQNTDKQNQYFTKA